MTTVYRQDGTLPEESTVNGQVIVEDILAEI